MATTSGRVVTTGVRRRSPAGAQSDRTCRSVRRSQQQVSKDFDRLAEHVEETLGARRALVSEAVYNRCIKELLDDEEWRDAARTISEYNEWVDEYKDLKELQEHLDRIEERQGDS